MWEGEPVGVDPKRPLVGFALTAVLCAVLMALSVGGRGWSTGVFEPGRPIAGEVTGDVLERAAVPAAVAAGPVSIPVELSTQPLGTAAAGPLPTQDPSSAVEPASTEAEIEVAEVAV